MSQLKAELGAYKAECGRLTKMLSDTLEIRSKDQDVEPKGHQPAKAIEQQQAITDLK